MAILKGLGIFFLSRPIFYSLGTQIFFNCSKWLSRGSRGNSGHHAVGLITIAKLTALPKNSDSGLLAPWLCIRTPCPLPVARIGARFQASHRSFISLPSARVCMQLQTSNCYPGGFFIGHFEIPGLSGGFLPTNQQTFNVWPALRLFFNWMLSSTTRTYSQVRSVFTGKLWHIFTS